MLYHRKVQVEFNHCDPAGIVFYPRYFEMTNSVVENFFAEAMGYPFRRMHLEESTGVPTVRIEAEFQAPSRLGDILDFTLRIDRIGTSSAALLLRAEGDGQQRLQVVLTIVWVGPGGKALPWPQEIREKMTAFKEQSDGS
ncbi:acyl-CoA thioesterase [Paracoccus sp. (in: a-proteobacteria)]|uniref:acyl-CoA thioesterase n=1 Tax=Paracoccus sp. TaxID=267 RepID=UPI003A8695A6